jgi:hypothetical protein
LLQPGGLAHAYRSGGESRGGRENYETARQHSDGDQSVYGMALTTLA